MYETREKDTTKHYYGKFLVMIVAGRTYPDVDLKIRAKFKIFHIGKKRN